jgi:hypothetical protein
MYSSSEESDIQFQLYFLDCQPNSIIRTLNDQSVFDHLYRAATNRILKFDKSYQRKESYRVTDIDQLSVLPTNMTRIEMIKIENPITEEKTSLETDVRIPPAPPLPASLDLAIKLQKSVVPSPDQKTLWAKVILIY